MIGSCRVLRHNYMSTAEFVAAAQAGMAQVAQGATPGSRQAWLGVWLDDDGQSVFMRLVRDVELDSGAGWTWRPHRAFQADLVTTEGAAWLAEKFMFAAAQGESVNGAATL